MARHLTLDIHCKPCRRAVDPDRPWLAPRLMQIERTTDGQVLVTRFTYEGERVIPNPHQRPDGGNTWQLRCPHGHNRPAKHERVLAALAAMETFPAGQERPRIWL
jgi:hypothetical protein